MDAPTWQSRDTFLVRQKVTAFVNRYVITAPTADDANGELVAFVEQKRIALREEVTFFADEKKSQPIFRFKARKVIDLGATYDVTAADGSPIGTFRKDFRGSLLRSTWHLEQPLADPPLTAVGRERSALFALVRRAWSVFEDIPLPIKYHFDFTESGRPLMSVDKATLMLDNYRVTIQDPRLDRRLAIAMAVALDALQGR
jgi:uncharacterized protein YxjI